MEGFIVLVILWALFSTIIFGGMLLIEESEINEFNVYMFVICLPGMIFCLPFYLLFLLAKFVFSLSFIQKIHYFLNTPVGELFSFSIKIERK